MRIRGRIFVAVFSISLATTGIASAQAPQTSAPAATTIPPPQPVESLPRPDFRFQGQVGRTYQDSDPPTFPQVLRPPKGAPNVLLILLDDAGFGQFSVFGGASPRRIWRSSQRRACVIPASTRRRCARQRVRHC
jgi:hypothetical protein